jgi:XTP/dITP diphosphohydrolase
MNTLVFATNNIHKLGEVRAILKGLVEISSLQEIGCNEEIPEEQDSLEGNAAQKGLFVYNKFRYDCIADDTGLEIEALNGEPGVFSARYAGEKCTFDDNIELVLRKMKGIENRKARFRTVIALVEQGKVHYLEGSIHGKITTERHGKQGFGYDPVFIPDGFDRTFAEMSPDEKNAVSHRARAVLELYRYLKG